MRYVLHQSIVDLVKHRTCQINLVCPMYHMWVVDISGHCQIVKFQLTTYIQVFSYCVSLFMTTQVVVLVYTMRLSKVMGLQGLHIQCNHQSHMMLECLS